MQNGNGYQGFNDMFDGGGMGQSGQSFEGGGLLSMIANMIAKPRGSQQGQPEQPMGGLLSPQARPAMPMQAQPQPMQPQYPNTAPPGTMQPMPPMQYSGRGNLGMPQQPPAPMQNPHPPMYQPPMQQPMQYSGRGSVGMPMQSPAQSDPAEAAAQATVKRFIDMMRQRYSPERFSDMLASGQLDDMYGSWMDNNETITPPLGLR
jgi:hypothetical protein